MFPVGNSSPTGSPPHAWGQPRPPLQSSLVSAVHPHMRGDNQWRCLHQRRDHRFTPTCVGTTDRLRGLGVAVPGSPPHAWGQRPCSCNTKPGYPVHPHMRGDNIYHDRKSGGLGGSPPHAWGQRRRRLRGRHPAPVHPHMRGDNYLNQHYGGQPARFTPTCVGTTTPRPIRFEPSSRFTPTCVGTTILGDSLSKAWDGSPPHAWGQQPYGRGSTYAAEVHPHMRGDNTRGCAEASAPRRFTPTCVGTT